MEIHKSVVLLLACWLLGSGSMQAQSTWRGIQPGTSTRAQVERVIGAPVQALTESLVEYKGAQANERVFVQYRSGAVVDRIEILLPVPVDRGAAQQELGLAPNPEVSKKNNRGKTEEFYGSAMIVLTLGAGGVERRAYYSRELFESAGGRIGGTPIAPVISAPPPSRVSANVTIPTATKVEVRLSRRLSTEKNSEGERFEATLDQPIVVEAVVVAEKGAPVEGRIARLIKSGRVSGRAEMHLELTGVRSVGGAMVAIATGTFVQQAEGSAGSDAKKAGLAAGIGAAIGAIAGGGKGAAIGAGAGGAAGGAVVLATRGKPAEVPVEAKLTFQLTAPATVPGAGQR